MAKRKKKFYAVAVGRVVGVYDNWEECEKQVKGFPNACFKSFPNKSDCDHYIAENSLKHPHHIVSNNDGTRRKRLKTDTTPPIAKLTFLVSFDGGSRGNPGIAGSGAEVIFRIIGSERFQSLRKKIRIREYIGHATNNAAEYNGAICGLRCVLREIKEFATKHVISSTQCEVKLVIQGDSQVVIKQLSGEYGCKSDNLIPLYNTAKSLLADLDRVVLLQSSFEHVFRKDNTIADSLANDAMDGKRSWVTIDDDDGNDINCGGMDNDIIRLGQQPGKAVKKERIAT